jgi:hypothetical protein
VKWLAEQDRVDSSLVEKTLKTIEIALCALTLGPR